jgi:AAHS family 4-hydroxybenzoate transporter-like MFS transporter
MSGTPTNEIGQVIDERPVSGLQMWAIFLCSLVILLDGYDIQVMALAVPSLIQEWGLPAGEFKFALSAALFGIGCGAFFVSPIGDRLGRRTVIIIMSAIVGVATIATAFAADLNQLFFWRFVTGVGLGAGMANATAMSAEYAPQRRRAVIVAGTYCNIALGALIAGFIAPPLIAAFSWHAIFIVGGVLPLILCALMIFTAPESIRFLVNKKPGDPRIAKALAKIAPDVDPATVYAAEKNAAKQSILAVLSPPYTQRTLLLWLIFLLNLFALYTMISWLPTILVDAGWSRERALQGGVLIQAGGIMGGLLQAWFVDKKQTAPAMFFSYLIAGVCLTLFLVVPSDVPKWGLMLVAIGAGVSGAQVSLNVLATAFYPSLIRATGVGWANAAGRIGAVLAPILGGFVLEAGVPPIEGLAMLAVPVGICALCILLLPLVWKQGEEPGAAPAKA